MRPDIAERVEGRPQRFVVFCDDLTFDAGEAGYKTLKVMLDGYHFGDPIHSGELRRYPPLARVTQWLPIWRAVASSVAPRPLG